MGITLVLITLLALGNAWEFTGVSAEPAPTAGGTTPAVAPVASPVPAGAPATYANIKMAEICRQGITEYGDAEFVRYTQFMEDHFKNKSSTASLMLAAIRRYDQFKADITRKYDDLVAQQLGQATNFPDKNITVMSQAESIIPCQTKAQQYIIDANKLLEMRAVTTSNIKQSSIFVEKYKQINTKLQALNIDFLKMTQNINAFDKKLPCYVKLCVQ